MAVVKTSIRSRANIVADLVVAEMTETSSSRPLVDPGNQAMHGRLHRHDVFSAFVTCRVRVCNLGRLLILYASDSVSV